MTSSGEGAMLAPIEAWHEVGAAGEPAFQKGWMNFCGFDGIVFKAGA